MTGRDTAAAGQADPRLADLTYVLPIKTPTPAPAELGDYLKWLAGFVEVIVADGSAPNVFSAHRAVWGSAVRHLPVSSRTANGKVAGVTDGIANARTPAVIVADDDVRYDLTGLLQMARLLATYDVVLPQNYFEPLPWHAQWDSARSLLNRAFGGDYPGTLGVRRAAFVDSGGYCGGVLFENLELVRTLTSRGHSCCRASEVFVRRIPPSFAHFRGQRVRQAYDSLAQPGRLAVELALAPAIVALLAPRSRRAVRAAVAAALPVLVAEVGRRRGGATRVFPARTSWWAPGWVLERAVCSWLALLARRRGGARYGGGRLPVAAHSPSELPRRNCAADTCGCRTQVWPAPTRTEAAA